MLTSNSFAVLISILSFIVALLSAWYGFKYTKTNSLFAIQRLVLEFAKDCNNIYKIESDKIAELQANRPIHLFDFDFEPTLKEMLRIVAVLDATLKNYGQTDQRTFFLNLFWLQINPESRHHIEVYSKEKYHDDLSVSDKAIIKELNRHFEQFYDENLWKNHK